MSGEFIHVTLLSVFGTVFVGTGALVSNIMREVGEYLVVAQGGRIDPRSSSSR